MIYKPLYKSNVKLSPLYLKRERQSRLRAISVGLCYEGEDFLARSFSDCNSVCVMFGDIYPQ